MDTIFELDTISYLRQLLEQYSNIKYGLNSVLNVEPDSSNSMIFDPTTKKILIPNFNKLGEYMCCGHFALESFGLFKKIRSQLPHDIQSFGYLSGSNDKYGGHNLVVLSPRRDDRLRDYINLRDNTDDFIEDYLNRSMIFDTCDMELIPYRESNFKPTFFLADCWDYNVLDDNVAQLNESDMTYFGSVNEFFYGIGLDKHSGYPHICFCKKDIGFAICNIDQYRYWLQKFSWLDSPEIRTMFDHFWNMKYATNLELLISSNSVIY
jgi:hypothetical protein